MLTGQLLAMNCTSQLGGQLCADWAASGHELHLTVGWPAMC